MSTSTTPTKAFSSRLLGLIKHPKFFWWCGHLLLLVQSFRYYLAYAYGNSDTAASAYAWAYSGVLLSYAIVLFRTLNWPSLTKWREDLVLLTRIDNVQYTMLALVWYFSEPVAIFRLISSSRRFTRLITSLERLFQPWRHRHTCLLLQIRQGPQLSPPSHYDLQKRWMYMCVDFTLLR